MSYFEKHWGIVSKQILYNDKVVLDLGADNGTTAELFLKWGAKRVVAVEGDVKLGSELVAKYSQSNNVIPIQMMIINSSQIEELIKLHKPDIVKVDIEGAEIHLLNISSEVISSVGEWAIEVHSEELEIKITDFFNKNGYAKHLIPLQSQGHDWISYYEKNKP